LKKKFHQITTTIENLFWTVILTGNLFFNLQRNTAEIPLSELEKKTHRHISQMENVRNNYCEFGSSGSGSQPATCRRRIVCVVCLGSFIQSGVSRGGRVIKKLLY
jgi:hypothetical protein